MMTRLHQLLSFVAAAIALGACAQTEAPDTGRPMGANRTVDELIANLPPGGITTPGVAYASIDLTCGNKVYTVKTGTDGGRCDVIKYPDKPQHNHAVCSDGGNGAAGANCTEGCVSSENAGSCSVKSLR